MKYLNNLQAASNPLIFIFERPRYPCKKIWKISRVSKDTTNLTEHVDAHIVIYLYFSTLAWRRNDGEAGKA